MFHASTCPLHLKATQVRCGAHTDLRRGGEWGRWGVEGRPLPKPSQSRPGAALYPTCASVARGWAGSRSSWPDSAGRRPSQAEKPWLEVRGSGGARSGVLLAGRRAKVQRPAPAAAATDIYTAPGRRDPLPFRRARRKPARGQARPAERRAASARRSINQVAPTEEARGAKHYGAGAGTAPGTR